MSTLGAWLRGVPVRRNPWETVDVSTATELGQAFLVRPAVPEAVAAVCQTSSTGGEALERLAARGLVPLDWVDDPQRHYRATCSRCAGSGADPHRGRGTWLCRTCRGRGSERLVAAPLWLVEALAARPQATLAAEALAEEAAGRLGLRAQGTSWWGLDETSPGSERHLQLGHDRFLVSHYARADLDPDDARMLLVDGRAAVDAFWRTDPCGPLRFPELWGAPGHPAPPGLMTRLRTVLTSSLAHQLQLAALGSAARPSTSPAPPDFLAPLRSVWALGFGALLVGDSQAPEEAEVVLVATRRQAPAGHPS